MAKQFLQKAARLSRDRGFLLKSALGIVMVSVAASFAASILPPRPWERAGGGVEVAGPPSSLDELIPMIRFGLHGGSGTEKLFCAQLAKDGSRNLFAEEIEAGLEDFRSEADSEAVRIWWGGLASEDPSGAIARLGSVVPASPLRDTFLADLHLKSGDSATALTLYRKVAEGGDDRRGYAGRSSLYLARLLEDRVVLRELLADPAIRATTWPELLLPLQAFAGDHAGLIRSLLLTESGRWVSPAVAPSLFLSAIWFLILLAFRPLSRSFLGLGLLAFLLGILSAILTLYAVFVQEEMRGFRFRPEDPAVKQLLALVAGVALREEFLKLLCFLPLAIALRRRGKALDVLLLGAMVGLGFAFHENLFYLRPGSPEFPAWARLLTANALHFSLTGIAGYATWRILARRGRGWEEGLATFLSVVLAHAGYNALLSVPALADYSVLAPLVVAVIAYRFFDPLREHMETTGLHLRPSPLGIFVLGSVLLTCGTLVSASFAEPFRSALASFTWSVASMIPLAFAFISRFRDL